MNSFNPIYRKTIGIDVSSFNHPITGIGRYTIEVVSKLVLNDKVNWILYSNLYHEEFKSLEGNNIKFKFLRFNVRYSKLIWGQIFLPAMLAKDKVDLFWSPTHRSPYLGTFKIPAVITIHDLNWKKVPLSMKFLTRFLDSFLMPASIKKAAKIISVSNSTALDICDQFPEASSKVYTIHLGASNKIDKKTIGNKADVNLLFHKYILFVGTLEPRKNLVRLVEAFSLVPINLREDIKLVLVGGHGWGMKSIADICQQFKVVKDVVKLGYVSDFELEKLYQHAYFLVIPSLYEGFGLPIVEAMKYGVPSLTSNLSSMPEIAGDASIQVDPYSVDSIKDGLVKMLSDGNLLIKLRECANKRCGQFDWSITAQQTMDVFLDALNTNV